MMGPNNYGGQAQTLYGSTVQAPVRSPAEQGVLLQRVCYLLASGLLVTAMSSYLCRDAYDLVMPFIIASFVLIFVLGAVARKPGVNVLVYYIFCAVEGGMLGPLVASYVRNFGSGIVWEAFLLTAIAVAGVGSYAYTSGKDFGFLGRGLIWALFALILVGIASWFIVGLNTPLVVLGYETIVVAVFVGFLLYDFSKIRLRYSPDDYTIAAVQVYLDFINLFLAILRILSILQGGGGRRR